MVSLQGVVEMQRSGQSAWQRVERLDTRLCEGDRLRVGPLGRAALLVGPSALIRVDQNTVMGLRITTEETLVEFDSGAIYSISRFPRRYRINSPFVNANVEGTEFLVALGSSRAEVAVYEGRVRTEDRVGSGGDKALLQSGQIARFSRGNPAEVQALINPTDAVQWALYYPVLDAAPDRAAQLLRVGRVEEADRELSAAGQRADALALSAIIRVTKNDKQGALQLAQQAIAADPNSARAYLAQSYALQADFKLQEALAAANRAVELAPANSIARARQAELLLSLGRLKEAERAANEAVKANPGDSRARTMLGFVHLARFNTAPAREQFQQAVALDTADPLPRLGLGLAAIKDGRLSEGREQIEVAVALDPQNALLRSYLGKAYSDEQRDAQATEQFARAKDLDPRDPTPWFYDAIRLQALNRPGEALRDMQESIARNDNRAVYRSRLLLDEDQAARSASRARIYSDLGFDELAVREARSALIADPGAFAAHRFLAEAYLPMPGFDIARVNESLQSQLLQPVNASSLPPQLQQIRSPFLLGSGPITPSFQEFNPLFARDRHSLSMSGVAGSGDTWADELIYGYYGGRRSIQLAQSRYDTNGFRENADLREDFLRAFYQEDFDPQSSFQVELSRSASTGGDPRFQFESGNFSPNLRSDVYTSALRLGARHSWTSNSTLIGSLIVQRQNTRFHDAIVDPPLEVTFDSPKQNHSYNGELQYLGRMARSDFVTGVGIFERKETGEFTSSITFAPFPPDQFVVPIDARLRSRNAYVYGNLGEARRARLILGASVDHVEDPDPTVGRSDTQFSPKLGAIVPVGATTVRLAAFRGIKRLPATHPSIEPTQVAGFNQVYDDFTQTRFWRYGLGADHSWSRRLHGGIEMTWRDVEAPVTANIPVEHGHEWLHRAYVSWLATDRMAFAVEPRFERVERELTTPTTILTVTEIQTWTVPLTATYHQTNGVFTRARLSWVSQQVGSQNSVGDRDDSSDTFNVLDFSIGTRLPQRRGVLSLDFKNLLNEKFRYRDTTFLGFARVPLYAPERAVYGRVQLTF